MVKQSFIQQDSCFTKYVLFASLLKFLNFYFKQMQDGNSLREALMFAQGISICMQYFVFSMYNIINSKYGIGSSNKYLLPMLPLPCNLDTNEEYGNMGHGVFKQGVQNQKDFCLRINILKEFYFLYKIGPCFAFFHVKHTETFQSFTISTQGSLI